MSRVDVMVTCYNYGRFLRQCVESVLTQSHRDLRVVIIDDASTDETPQVCAELAAEDPRVQIVRHPQNLGAGVTFNQCIDLAEADYLLGISADDFLLPGALAKAVAVLDERPEVGIVHGAWLHYRTGDPLPEVVEETQRAAIADPAWLVERLARSNFVSTCATVSRTSVQRRLGHFRLDLTHAADLDMWLRFAVDGPVAMIRTPLAVYRRHDDNMSLGFDKLADLDQCAAAFEPHAAQIRRQMPDGAMVEARIREALAQRAEVVAGMTGERPQCLERSPLALARASGTTASLAVIILCERQPQNVAGLAREAREVLPGAKVFVLDQSAKGVLGAKPERLTDVDLRRIRPGQGAAEQIALAASSPFDHFLIVGDDTLLRANQIGRLVGRALVEPDRVHALGGHRMELDAGVVSLGKPMARFNGALSIADGPWVVSKAQAMAAMALCDQLGFGDWEASGPVGDILLSCASLKPALCHDLGVVTRSPVFDAARGDGRTADEVRALRVEAIRKLLVARKMPVFSPMIAKPDLA